MPFSILKNIPPMVSFLGIFFVFKILYFILSKSILLDESVFFDTNFLLLNACKGLRFLGVFLVGIFFGVVFWRCRWVDVFRGFWEKVLFLVGIGVLVVTFSLSPYNFYLQNWFVLDRILFGILGFLCIYRPSFLFLFAFYTHFLASQYSYPFGGQGYEWTHCLWVDVLLLAFVLICKKRLLHFYFSNFSKKNDNHSHTNTIHSYIPHSYPLEGLGVIYMYALMVYAYPATQKLFLGEYVGAWILENQLFHYLEAGHHQSWEFSEGDLAFWKYILQHFNLFFTFFVFFVEMGFLAFWHKTYFQMLAFGRFLLHLGVFFFTGNSFWSWQLFNLLLFLQIFYLDKLVLKNIFQNFYLAFCINIFILFGHYFFDIKPLAWWDTNFYQINTLQATDQAGNTQTLTPYHYAPYTIWGRKAQFYYLHKNPYLTGTYGSTKNHQLYQALKNAKNEQDIEKIKTRFGKNEYDSTQAKKFYHFTHKLLLHLQNPSTLNFTNVVPLHFYTFFQKNKKENTQKQTKNDKEYKKFELKNTQKIQVLYKEVLGKP